MKEEKCYGCNMNGNCLPYGTRLVQEGTASCCTIDGTLKAQQHIEVSCQNNYECTSNQCSNSKCVDLAEQLKTTNSMLEDILNWLKRVWG